MCVILCRGMPYCPTRMMNEHIYRNTCCVLFAPRYTFSTLRMYAFATQKNYQNSNPHRAPPGEVAGADGGDKIHAEVAVCGC